VHRNVEHRSLRMPRSLGLALLIAGVLLAAASLSQCRLVEDRITGVSGGLGSQQARSDCLDRCNQQYRAARAAENNRHRIALQACGNDKTCRKNEDQLHQQNLQALIDRMQQCKQGCYNEGAAIGGR